MYDPLDLKAEIAEEERRYARGAVWNRIRGDAHGGTLEHNLHRDETKASP